MTVSEEVSFCEADDLLEEPIALSVFYGFCAPVPQSGPEALRQRRSTAEAARRIITGEPSVLCFFLFVVSFSLSDFISLLPWLHGHRAVRLVAVLLALRADRRVS